MTPRRVAAFATTAIGAVLLAAGAVQAWATVRIGGEAGFPPIDTKGTDVLEGTLALVAGVAILGVFLLLTVVPPAARRVLGVLVIVLGVLAAGLIVSAFARPDERLGLGVVERQAVEIARQAGLRPEEVQRELEDLTETERRPGILLALAGALVAVGGGMLTLLWVAREGAPEPANAG